MQTDAGTPPARPSTPRIPWWDDLPPATRSQLELPPIASLPVRSVDVVIVGGGVAGLSAALRAGRAGARVLLLERDESLGGGATGRNAGILSAGINMHLVDLDPGSPQAAFWPATTRELLALAQQAAQPGALLQAHLTGALSLAVSAAAARKLAREARARAAAGLRAEMWTPLQVQGATLGRLDMRGVACALWLPDEGRIQPLSLLAHLASQARAEGIALAGRADVRECQEVRGSAGVSQWRLKTSDGLIISARGLVYAVGPTVAANARIYALAFADDLPSTFPLFWDAAPYVYADYRPGNGRLTVSGGRYGKAGVTRRDETYQRRLAQAARRWLPELAEREPRYAWGVDIAVSADMVPTLRAFGERAPACAIEGLGALGVLPGIVLAQRAGDLVALRQA
jgi:glycine/D-amino acid oxidase-like deaminating enzyme